MTGEAVQRHDALRARSRQFRDLVQRTYADLEEQLPQVQRPYVALSGGKDSLVVLAILAEMRPGIVALWSDDELEHDGQYDVMDGQCDRLGAKFWSKTCGEGVTHGGWFRPWTDSPAWRNPHGLTMQTTLTTGEYMKHYGFDASVTGLRADEALYRKRHAQKLGSVYEVKGGRIVYQPLIWWSVDDVWAFIAGNGLPYHPAYDAMSGAGVPRDKQRIGPLPLTPRWVLQAVDPTLPARLEARYGKHW